MLYISGFVQDAAARAAFASEHSAFVAKPFTPELLAGRVRELLATAETEANCVVVPSDHPWAGRRTVALRDLDAQPFVFFERRDGPDGYDALMSTFASSGVAPHLVTAVPTVIELGENL